MTRIPRRCLLAMLAALPLAAAAPPPADLGARIDDYLEPFVEAAHLSGYLVVARGGEVLYERAMGRADYELDVPIGPATRFGVASVNKPMTIVVAIRMMEEGKLAPTDPIARWLPEFPRAEKITVEQLIRHRAGIPHRLIDDERQIRHWTPAELVTEVEEADLAFAPGAESSYSSGGFSVLARVLELAGGKPYAELLAEHVLRPAGMEETSDAGTRAILERRASSYYFDTGGLLNAPPADVSYLVGAGSVFSTPRDLMALQRALLAGELGRRAREALVRESGNLGWNGLANGYRAFADYDAATGVSVVLASNLISGALDKIRSALPKIAAGEEVPVPAPINAAAVNVDPEILQSYQGAYELRPGRNLELRVVGGRVQMNDWLLIPTSETTLFSPQDYAEIEVVFDESGEVERLDWTTGGQTYPLPKVGPPPSTGSSARRDGAAGASGRRSTERSGFGNEGAEDRPRA